MDNRIQFFRAVEREWCRAEGLDQGGWQGMRKMSRGFSMLEILIVLLLMGIVAAFALPTAISHLRDYRLHSDAQAIASYLNVVRSEHRLGNIHHGGVVRRQDLLR